MYKVVRHVFGGREEGAEDGRGKREVLSLFLEFVPHSPVPCFSERKAVVLPVFWWP